MNAFFRSSAIIVFICVTTICISTVANAQIVIHVDIANGSLNPPNDGRDGWGSDAFRFLQDALDAADGLFPTPQNPIQIWVAAAFDEFDEPIPYRPDQSKVNAPHPTIPPSPFCGPYGNCDPDKSFELRSNVRLIGGFPADPHHADASTILDRDPAQYRTILSGDVRAANVSATAVLDGFVVRGGIDLRSAQPRFRGCVIQLHEAAAVRCDDASHVMMYRCTFENLDCDSIIVEGQSRLELLLCEPAAVLDGMVGVAQRDSHASPCRRDAWQPAGRATGCGRARVAAGSELLVIDQQRWDELVDE